MVDWKSKGKGSRFLRRTASGAPSGTAGEQPQSNADPQQPQQSSREQMPQQASSPRPTSSGRNRFFGLRSLSRSPSPLASPPLSPGAAGPNRTTVEPTATSAPHLLVVPHMSHLLHGGSPTIQSHIPPRHDPLPYTPSSSLTTELSYGPGPSFSSDVHGSSSVPLSARITKPTASENLTHSHGSSPVPDTPIDFLSHSSEVWGMTLQIAELKLKEKHLPPLDPTLHSSQSEQDNIQDVVKELNILQKDSKEKRWSYLPYGKQVIVAERLDKILKCVEKKYSEAVGSAIRGIPKFGSVVWAAVRVILQVRTVHIPSWNVD